MDELVAFLVINDSHNSQVQSQTTVSINRYYKQQSNLFGVLGTIIFDGQLS